MDELDLDTILTLVGIPPTELEQRVLARVEWTIEKLSRSQIIVPKPTIEYNLKGATAGYAYRHKNLIRLNLELLHNQPDDFIERTVPHEIAHLAAFKYWPEHSPHGAAWQLVMERVLGLPATRCHSYDLSTLSTNRTVTYDCACAEGCTVGPTVHKRIQNNTHFYKCKKCKLSLVVVRS